MTRSFTFQPSPHLCSCQASSIVDITLPSLNLNQTTTIQFDTFATPLLQTFSAVTYMNLYSKIQIFMTSRLGLSLHFPFAECLRFLFFLFFIFLRNDGGIILNFFSLLWKCGVVYSRHFPFYLISHIFYFIATFYFILTPLPFLFIATFYFILFFENSRQQRTFQDYLSTRVDHTN